jgi:hypothetical protein
MLGTHPITGKEIRVINTDVSIWRESKTLAFTQNPCIWDTVYTDFLTDGKGPSFRLILKEASLDEIKECIRTSKLVLISKKCITSSEPVKNVLYLEEIHLIYPHLGDEWDGTVEDASVIMAGLLRFRRISGVWNQRAEYLHLTQAENPPRLWWVTQYFNHADYKRKTELRKCLLENMKSPLIDKIILLNETKEDIPSGPHTNKVEEIVIGHRLTYQDVFDKIYDFPDDVIVAFANADIFIDTDSWKEIWNLNLENKFLALLRYDLPSNGLTDSAKMFGPRADSQDTWVVRAADVKQRSRETWSTLNFKFGKMGCDNLIALEMMRNKFLVVNPSQTIKTFHNHSSEIRNYNKLDVIEAPLFHFIHPTSINDLAANFKLPKYPAPSVLKRNPHGVWNPVKPLDPQPPAEQKIHIKESFETADGLVFDTTTMYIGESKSSKLLWNSSKIHGLMPTMKVDRALVAPWPEKAETVREIYCLKYLSKILRIWENGSGEFFGIDSKEYLDLFQIFEWNTENLPIITREEDALVWCKEAEGFCHEDSVTVLKEDITALRKYVKGWSATVNSKRMIIVQDNKILTNSLVLDIEQSLEAASFEVEVIYPCKTSIDRIRDVFCGAVGIICSEAITSVGWNWLLPVGANVFEVSKGETIGLEISSAADLNHHYVSGVMEEILRDIGSASYGWSEVDLPIVWVPVSKSGFFSHPGDSFREMLQLWKKAGYIQLQWHDGVQVWWESVGAKGVLLYDRPTNEWRLAAPENEREWRLALFGNPKASASAAVAGATGAAATGAKTIPWFFWPRRPSLVEELVDSGAAETSYDARQPGPVFYGKNENLIQERRRKGDWASVCEEFKLVHGDEKYPFTQMEYLQKLASSRFGLCLPGYGYKCHREIECMAMGCVPIVSEGVDMDSYANPPVEGVHYLRVKKPEDIPAMLTITKSKWETMSSAVKTWWKDNASCKGSFELTKRLCSAV